MDAKQINAIEKLWRQRAEAMRAVDNVKPGSVRYKRSQADFFAGAMIAANAIGGSEPPPRWVFSIMRGDDIAKLEPLAEGNEEVAAKAA